VVDDSLHVGDECDLAISHQGCTREHPHPLHRGMHRLDDHLLGAAHLVHQQSKPPAPGPQDEDVFDLARIALCRRMTGEDLGLGPGVKRPPTVEHLLESYDRQQAVAQPVHLGVEGVLDGPLAARVQADNLFQLTLGNRKPVVTDLDDQAGDDRQRQGDPQLHRGSFPGRRVDCQRTLQLFDVGLHDIHAHPPTRDIGHLAGGGKAGQQNQRIQLATRHRVEFGRGLQPQ